MNAAVIALVVGSLALVLALHVEVLWWRRKARERRAAAARMRALVRTLRREQSSRIIAGVGEAIASGVQRENLSGVEKDTQLRDLGFESGDHAPGLGDVTHEKLDEHREALVSVMDRVGRELRDRINDLLHVRGVTLADGQADLGAHIDSSSVVPGVAPSGDDATVEAAGDAARVDSSARRVTETGGAA